MNTRSSIAAYCAALFLAMPSAASAQAQQTPIPERPSIAPQIELDGTGIASVEGHFPRFSLPSGSQSSTSRINVSDSALLLGASERLLRAGAIGSFVIGATTTESNAAPSGTALFLHQLFLDYQSRPFESYIGRTDTATRLIDFPTLRGDDLNEFVNVQDPFSSGDNVEEHRYSDQAAVIFNRALRTFVNLHAQHLIASAPGLQGQSGLNSFGVNVTYQGPPGLEDIEKVPTWGAGYERQTIDQSSGGAANVLYAGVVYNINADPIDRLDLRLQDLYSFGNSLNRFQQVSDTFRASANAIAASLRFLHSRAGVPGYSVSLTAGYKGFSHVADSDTFALALTGVKRLGGGFDLVLQYIYQHRNAAYASMFDNVHDEHAIEIGFVFNFNNIF
ncbi:MAG TPA: hypothetical protein VGS41_01190, partial [Chthonomonadales bacterium]|nr:hypothetical protein [Chthonomonadales bacterium]